jgi:hypothetical protein
MKTLLKTTISFVVLAFLIDGCSNDSSSSTSASTEESAPEGYERGLTCTTCEGTGRYLRDLVLIPNTKGNPCASCSGKGFNWRRKSDYSYSSSNNYESNTADNSYVLEPSTSSAKTADIPLSDPSQNRSADDTLEHTEDKEITLTTRYTGSVGKLTTAYDIKISNNEITGSYFYLNRPSTVYRLEGQLEQDGTMRLIEYTDGEQTASCILAKAAAEKCYLGKMNNTDGRSFRMSLCEQ